MFTHSKTIVRLAMAALLTLLLTACGGSGGSTNNDYDAAYLHFYNGSSDGATVYMRTVDGSELGYAQFGDASALVSSDKGDLELEFYRIDRNDQEVVIDSLTVTLKTSYKTLVVLSGDFNAPVFDTYEYYRETLEDHFHLMAMSTMLDSTTTFDLYMSNSGDPFEAANYLGTITSGELTEYSNLGGDDDSEYFTHGEYTIYLTQPGSDEVIFETPTLSFAYNTEYVLVTRDLSGAIKSGMAMDVVLNSTTVYEVTDVAAPSQYRIYNSLDSDSPLTVTLTGDNEEKAISKLLEPGEVGEFTEVEYGDYRITASIADSSLLAMNNKLVTLNQSESKAIVIYQNNTSLASLSFVESSASQAYDKTINFVNLVEDYADVDFYLVRHDETIDTAEYSFQHIDFAETRSAVVPADYYEVIAVHKDSNDEQYLLFRYPLYGFNEAKNYFITVEPAQTSSGYEIKIVN